MSFKSIAFVGVAALLAVAPPAFAMGGGGGHEDAVGGTHYGRQSNGQITGNFEGGTYQGTYSNGTFSGTYTVAAAEPLATLAVGLGLLGSRYIRRRK